jgi:hypothetical protein
MEKLKKTFTMKNNNLDNEVNMVIYKNNILKTKIKKIKKVMVSLSKVIEDTVNEQNQLPSTSAQE